VTAAAVGAAAAFVLLVACSPAPSDARLAAARADYAATYSDASLAVLAKAVRPGMSKAEVVRRLGAPQYSPAPGVEYYGSRRVGRDGVFGLVVVYTDDGAPSARVRTVRLGPIGE
jgi:hypothetical protein